MAICKYRICICNVQTTIIRTTIILERIRPMEIHMENTVWFSETQYPTAASHCQKGHGLHRSIAREAVSYTHLTLPPICSV